jgi:hypothetical protein
MLVCEWGRTPLNITSDIEQNPTRRPPTEAAFLFMAGRDVTSSNDQPVDPVKGAFKEAYAGLGSGSRTGSALGCRSGPVRLCAVAADGDV